jgi:hypothetical protein
MQTYSPPTSLLNSFSFPYDEPYAPTRSDFTADEIAAVQRSFDDFKHGRTLSLEESEADTAELLASLYNV